MSIAPISGPSMVPLFGKVQATAGALSPSEKNRPESAAEEFMAYANMTPTEKMRADILASMGLKEDDLKAMNSKDRQRVEDDIAQKIKQMVTNDMEKKSGLIADVRA